MGTFDGPGLRLVVFLQGCNFRCLYCANPDTIDACGGKPTPAEEILRMATDQKPFFGRRGGVTFSGGEPTFQAAELIPLVRSLKEAGIHVCIDSNGGVWNPAVEELLGLVDLVLLDVKQADPERHRTLTGRENSQTLRTAAWLETHNKPFWLRYVLVPGYSDAEADIRMLGERLGAYKSVERVELLPYHTLGVSCFIMFINISLKIENRFYKLTALGLSVEYMFQVFLTIGGVTKFIPSTGVSRQ